MPASPAWRLFPDPEEDGLPAWVPTGLGPAWAVPLPPPPARPSRSRQPQPEEALDSSPAHPGAQHPPDHTNNAPEEKLRPHPWLACKSLPQSPLWTQDTRQQLDCKSKQTCVRMCVRSPPRSRVHTHAGTRMHTGLPTQWAWGLSHPAATDHRAACRAPCQDPHPADRPESDTPVSFQPLKK